MRISRIGFFLVIVGAAVAACSSDNTPTGDAGVDAGVVVNDANQIPCAPRQVLQTICQQCHTRPMKNGAPFPLINRSDILATRDKQIIRDLMIQQVESGRMPLKPVTIDDASRQALLEWLKAGAPAVSPQTCEDAGTDAGPDVVDADATDQDADAGDLDTGADADADAADD